VDEAEAVVGSCLPDGVEGARAQAVLELVVAGLLHEEAGPEARLVAYRQVGVLTHVRLHIHEAPALPRPLFDLVEKGAEVGVAPGAGAGRAPGKDPVPAAVAQGGRVGFEVGEVVAQAGEALALFLERRREVAATEDLVGGARIGAPDAREAGVGARRG